jgi:hypothetical protein
MADKELRELLDEVAADAEAERGQDQDAPLPPHVKVSRPNRARSRVLQVRLNPDEFEAIERIAERRGLPASTVAREQLLAMVSDDQAGDSDSTAAALVDQLLLTASRLKDLQATGEGLAEIGGRSAPSNR